MRHGLPRRRPLRALAAGASLGALLAGTLGMGINGDGGLAERYPPTWEGDSTWANMTPYIRNVDRETVLEMRRVWALGRKKGRVSGRLGKIGDSIAWSSSWWTRPVDLGLVSDETGFAEAATFTWANESYYVTGDEPAGNTSGRKYGNELSWKLDSCFAFSAPTSSAVNTNPSWALVKIGTNDVNSTWADTLAWSDSLVTFVRVLQDSGIVPVIFGNTYEVTAATGSVWNPAKIDQANRMALRSAQIVHCIFVDTNAAFLAFAPNSLSYFAAGNAGLILSSDKIHPTECASGCTGGSNSRLFTREAVGQKSGYALMSHLTIQCARYVQRIVREIAVQ